LISGEADLVHGNPTVAVPATEAISSNHETAHETFDRRSPESAPAASNVFGILDSEGRSPGQLSRFSPRMVEVGVNDPSHGWVEVRAQGVLGQVSASLNAASPQAHAAIHAQLSGMAEYLAEREIGVHSLAVGNESSGGMGANPNGSFSGANTSGGSTRDAGEDGSEKNSDGNQMLPELRIGRNSFADRSMPATSSAAEIGGPRHLINLRV
jgi:hypothetical protein